MTLVWFYHLSKLVSQTVKKKKKRNNATQLSYLIELLWKVNEKTDIGHLVSYSKSLLKRNILHYSSDITDNSYIINELGYNNNSFLYGKYFCQMYR